MKINEEIIEEILAREKENSKIHIDIVRRYLEESIQEYKKMFEDAVEKISKETNECGFGNEHINKQELLKELSGEDLK